MLTITSGLTFMCEVMDRVYVFSLPGGPWQVTIASEADPLGRDDWLGLGFSWPPEALKCRKALHHCRCRALGSVDPLQGSPPAAGSVWPVEAGHDGQLRLVLLVLGRNGQVDARRVFTLGEMLAGVGEQNLCAASAARHNNLHLNLSGNNPPWIATS
jgi:hypothetical protein